MALTNKLSAIGDAIREKTGKTELLTLDAMPLEIASIETGGGGGIEVEPIVLSGDCSYACRGAMASKYIELFGDTVSTKDITNTTYMFKNYTFETIPFEINMKNGTEINMNNMFQSANNLIELPKINNVQPLNMQYIFNGLFQLREISMDYFDDWDFSKMSVATGSYSYDLGHMFQYCYSLRKLPLEWLNNANKKISYSYTYFYYGFEGCYVLEELLNLPLPYTNTYTSNMFVNTFSNNCRLKNITFETNIDGSPLVKQWKSQTINLTSRIGHCGSNVAYERYVSDYYNSGITKDKKIADDATYQALKDDPDAYAYSIDYARYNHDSAVRTINSLPDTSAYLATAGGTNTIKFDGYAGAKTDGGAINTLTAEEIAVATAKGWTITFA